MFVYFRSTMAGRTPIPVSHAMRAIADNLSLARRQQRISIDLLANRTNLSAPTVSKMLNSGTGSLENFLRIARAVSVACAVGDGEGDAVCFAPQPVSTAAASSAASAAVTFLLRYIFMKILLFRQVTSKRDAFLSGARRTRRRFSEPAFCIIVPAFVKNRKTEPARRTRSAIFVVLNVFPGENAAARPEKCALAKAA